MSYENNLEEDSQPDSGEGMFNIILRVKNEIFHAIKLFLKKTVPIITEMIDRTRRRFNMTAILAVGLSILFILYFIPLLQEGMSGEKKEVTNDSELNREASYRKQIDLMKRDVQLLAGKYNAYTTGQSYLVINTTDNWFFLFRNKKLVREGYCSSGSYILLKTRNDRHWVFKTPKGKYRIQGKTINPVWKKPDWAFIEEGLPVPPENDYTRFEYGVLGDYALSIGDGYLIHGTVYTRFLGMPVTHGCVRLNDEDLEAIYNTLNIGSRVYIF